MPAGPAALRLILASASPRRRDLLAQVGVVPNEIRPADIDETPLRAEAPQDLALRLARAKALTADIHPSPEELVLGADTVVAVGRRVLPKAESEHEARQCLALLSGRRHRVYSGLALRRGGVEIGARVVMSRVSFKRLSPEEIAVYLSGGEWRGKAGGYAIQGAAAFFVDWISGSYSNIVGLPLFETGSLLRGAGYRVAAAVPAR